VSGDKAIHEFTYRDDWYPTTDGTGPSLQSVNAASENLADWNQQSGWRSSFAMNGSPGKADRLPGDVNKDGVFNSTDLVLVFQHGEYEDAEEGNSTFDEGDWNGDGDFNTRDLVFVFQLALFQRNATHVLVRNPTEDDLMIKAKYAKDVDQLIGEELFDWEHETYGI
jgi:hypothetical protein